MRTVHHAAAVCTHLHLARPEVHIVHGGAVPDAHARLESIARLPCGATAGVVGRAGHWHLLHSRQQRSTGIATGLPARLCMYVGM